MPLMNINSDWMSNASSGLYIIYAGPLSCMFDCSITWVLKLHLGMKCLCSDNDKSYWITFILFPFTDIYKRIFFNQFPIY